MTELLIDRIFVCILYAICSMSFSFAAKFLFKIFAFHNTTLVIYLSNLVIALRMYN